MTHTVRYVVQTSHTDRQTLIIVDVWRSVSFLMQRWPSTILHTCQSHHVTSHRLHACQSHHVMSHRLHTCQSHRVMSHRLLTRLGNCRPTAVLVMHNWYRMLTTYYSKQHQNKATGYASQNTWCLSQATINWEGCGRKGIWRKNGGWRRCVAD